jgi:hypothetical protein
MPTAYYIITNDYVIKLVNENNLEKLDEYLKDDFDATKLQPKSTTDCHICPSIGSSKNYEDKIYNITSYATDIGNLLVLQHFSDKINVNYKPDGDGNAYDLIHLGVIKYVELYNQNDQYVNKNRFDIIMFLVDAQFKNLGTVFYDKLYDFYLKNHTIYIQKT